MALPGFVRRLSYHGFIRGVARKLPAGPLKCLRWLYYRLACPKDGVLNLELNGIRAKFYVSDCGELRILESFDCETDLLRLFTRVLRSGDCVYDVGASIGLWTAFLAKVVGHDGTVAAFEPCRVSYERLQQNLKLNRLTQVRAFPKALGELDGPGEACLGGIRLALGARTATKAAQDSIPVVQGDRFRMSESLPTPRAVKIDVEGCEWFVVNGLHQTLAEPACEVLCCEIHPRLLPSGVTQRLILDLVRSLGFSRVSLVPRGAEVHALCFKKEPPPS